ncbi:MAG: NAD-dependent epimerase/dehydratase family protein [Bacilli bacterium]|nr:NAD-dependent epimerase/dehydratase family protein [Bacilli bacterium]
MKKIIITGSTGHIGNNLIRYLVENYSDIQIKLLVRRLKDEAIDEFDCLKVVGDLSDISFLSKEIEEDSIVIHSAGLIDVTNKQISEMEKINNDLTRKLVDICIEKKVSKFIYISSVDAINKEEVGLIKEPTCFNPDLLESNYGKSKAKATSYVLDKINSGSLCGVILYPSAVIGPLDFKVSSIGQVLVDNIHNRIMARLDGKYNFIDVRDLSEAIAYCVFNDVGSSYLITGEIVSVDELFMIINEKLGKKKLPIKLPFSLIMFFANFMPLYYKLRGVKPVFTKFALKTLRTNCNYDNSKAIEDLKLRIRPAKDSINDAIDWFISHGN